MTQTPKGRLGLVKVSVWMPSELHARVKRFVDKENEAGRPTSISKTYSDSVRIFMYSATGKR